MGAAVAARSSSIIDDNAETGVSSNGAGHSGSSEIGRGHGSSEGVSACGGAKVHGSESETDKKVET